MRMDGTADNWAHSDASPKQISSPMQEDIYQTNGPPGEFASKITFTEKLIS